MHAVIVKLKKSNSDPKLSVRAAASTGAWQLRAMKTDADNDSGDAEDVVRQHVKNEGSNLSFMPICQALVGKGGEGRKCSTKACRHKQAPTIMLVVGCPSENVTYDDAA